MALALAVTSGSASADDAPEGQSANIHGAAPGELEAVNASNAWRASGPLMPYPPPPPAPPALSSPPRPATKPFSRGLLIAGASAAVASIPIVIIGAASRTQHEPAYCHHPSIANAYVCEAADATISGANALKDLAIGGGVAVGIAGLVMIMVGGREVPITPAPTSGSAAPASSLRPIVSLVTGATSAAVRVSF